MLGPRDATWDEACCNTVRHSRPLRERAVVFFFSRRERRLFAVCHLPSAVCHLPFSLLRSAECHLRSTARGCSPPRLHPSRRVARVSRRPVTWSIVECPQQATAAGTASPIQLASARPYIAPAALQSSARLLVSLTRLPRSRGSGYTDLSLSPSPSLLRAGPLTTRKP
jgi:hypothetical protein